jgi:hypothetical protein
MNPELTFILYLGAMIALVLSAAQENWRFLPVGLALALLPTLWTSAEVAL